MNNNKPKKNVQNRSWTSYTNKTKEKGKYVTKVTFSFSIARRHFVTCESGNWDGRNLYFRCAQSSRRPTTQCCGNLLPLPQTEENRLNHGQNMIIINFRDQASHDSGNVLFKKLKICSFTKCRPSQTWRQHFQSFGLTGLEAFISLSTPKWFKMYLYIENLTQPNSLRKLEHEMSNLKCFSWYHLITSRFFSSTHLHVNVLKTKNMQSYKM